jgi:PKD repeat protein
VRGMAGLRVVRPMLPGAHARSVGLLAAAMLLLCGLAGPGVALATTPVGTFTVDPASPQTGQTVTLTADQAEDPTMMFAFTYAWSVDGGATLDSTSARTVHTTFATAGTYHVTLTVTDPLDPVTGVATSTQAITATDPPPPPPPPNVAPTASFTFSPLDPRVGSTVTFTSTSTDDGTLKKFEWDLDGNGTYEVVGSSTRQVTFNTGGFHTVGLRVTDNGGLQDTFDQSIYVDQRPSASFDITPATTAAVGDTVTFTSTSTDPEGDPLTFAWDLDQDGLFDDGTGDSAQKAYPTPGTYSVRLRVTDSHGASSTTTGQVRVVADVAPQAGFGFTPSAPRAGEPVTFTSTSTDSDGTVAALQWDLDGNGQFNDAAGPTAQRAFPVAGSYTVSLRVTDDKGVSSIAFQTIFVLGSATQEQDALAGSTPGTSAPDALPPAAPVPSPGTSSPRLLSPFPIIRIRGRADATAVHVDLLSVQAPRGSRISARCRGKSCPRRPIAATATSSSRPVRLRGLERRFAYGVVLEIRVTKSGRIGKYTGFYMRRGKAPLRRDRCLRPGAKRPSRCPTQ